MKTYWFSREDGTTAHLTTPAKVGRTDTVTGDIIPCENGLHSGPTPFDALQYAAGPVLWEVEVDDDAVPHGDPVDKFASRSRRYLRRADLMQSVRAFAAKCALSVANLWEMPEVVREYLNASANGQDREDIRAAAMAAVRDADDATWDTMWASKAAMWTTKDATWATFAAGAAACAASAAKDATWVAKVAKATGDAAKQFNQIAMETLNAETEEKE